jgi:anti-anti-sigma regulatory factor
MAVLLRVPEVEDPDFIAEMTYVEGAVLRLSGSADRTSVESIGKMFVALHEELRKRGTRVLVIDVSDCDYMAATCFRQLLAFVNRVQSLETAQRYKLRLRGNRSVAWQVHSLAALACFDTDLISVEGSA